MNRIIFHIDVNSAYLSWTSVENLRTNAGPDLRTLPAIIGGDITSRHGIVLAKSIAAKSKGVCTGEPITSALKKCPELISAAPDHKMYSMYSKKLMDFLHNITPDIEQVSVDECYLDFTGISHLYSTPVKAAVQIKDSIYDALGFTVNVGISSNKLLAKMASDFEKPNKVHTLFPEEIPAKMWPLTVDELYMAGHSSVQTLHKLGIRTIGELAGANPDLLESHMKSHGRMLWEYANGIDDSILCYVPSETKGIGNSVTLPKDAETESEAYIVLRQLAEKVSARMRVSHLICANLCVEIKYNTFIRVSRQMTLEPPINTSEGIYANACSLFKDLWNGNPVRLLGIRSSKLMPDDTPVQMSIFDLEKNAVESEKQKKLDAALDMIKHKFGEKAVVRASMLENKKD